MTFKKRTVWFLLILALPIFSYWVVNTKAHRFSNSTLANELAGNGLYELFAAYLNNELDYDQFYSTINNDEAFTQVRQLLRTDEARFVDSWAFSVERTIKAKMPEKRMNVILVSVESFSADFMGYFGNQEKITPFLDSLALQSQLYTNLYATGTRTVRGLEALSLCVPPTPGQSIVRRPNNENLFTLGRVFEEKGYESKYIYGGYGYFDNMSYFFSHNDYEVVDRVELKDEEIDYENVWGVADENLFDLATREIEKSISNNKPVFAQIMTTSNHRPYTYPDGRIDIPSHTGRAGAVKYTDYAICQFVKEISKKPWFANTLLIIVADHCASSAGKTELPVDKYHIPMLVYSPGFIAPGVMDRLMSQIDIGPTVLGMLNFNYKSKFFGYDMAHLESGRERAFVSTYQSLGFIKGDELVVLMPQKEVKYFTLRDGDQVEHAQKDSTLLKEAISWYQTASTSFKSGLMN
ncbi:MAG: LTA synthase family protein [Cyclobacteriaceae bacterium]